MPVRSLGCMLVRFLDDVGEVLGLYVGDIPKPHKMLRFKMTNVLLCWSANRLDL